MKYIGMPIGMWVLFAGSFQKQLTVVFGCGMDTAKAVSYTHLDVYKRQLSKDFRVSLKSFASVALESVIGLLLSAVLLLPSVLVVLSNPRTSEYLSGFNLLLYGNSQRYGLILSSFFFPDVYKRQVRNLYRYIALQKHH